MPYIVAITGPSTSAAAEADPELVRSNRRRTSVIGCYQERARIGGGMHSRLLFECICQLVRRLAADAAYK